MVRWLICLLSYSLIFCQDDGLAPNFVYLEPIEDFYARESISLEIIITDRNAIDRATLRQANRLFSRMMKPVSKEEIMTIQLKNNSMLQKNF